MNMKTLAKPAMAAVRSGKIKIVRGGRERTLKPGGFEHFKRGKD